MSLETLNEKGFVFIGADQKPYWCALNHGKPWFMYWNEGHNAWVTYREVSQHDIFAASQHKLSDEDAEIYHEMNKEFCSQFAL